MAGYGWTLGDTSRDARVARHDGSLSGYFTAEFRWYLDEEIALFVASNTVEFPAPEATGEITRILFERRPHGRR